MSSRWDKARTSSSCTVTGYGWPIPPSPILLEPSISGNLPHPRFCILAPAPQQITTASYHILALGGGAKVIMDYQPAV